MNSLQLFLGRLRQDGRLLREIDAGQVLPAPTPSTSATGLLLRRRAGYGGGCPGSPAGGWPAGAGVCPTTAKPAAIGAEAGSHINRSGRVSDLVVIPFPFRSSTAEYNPPAGPTVRLKADTTYDM